MDLKSLKLSREMAKIMFPKEYEIGNKFDDTLHKLICETLESNKKDQGIAFAAVTASLSMQLAKMFAVAQTDPISVVKTFSDVVMSTYKEVLNIPDEVK